MRYDLSSVQKTLGPVLATAMMTALLAGCATQDAAPGDSNSSGATSSAQAAVGPKKYVDGTYSAAGSYKSPAGNETVDISLSIDAQGKITAAKFKGNTQNARSKEYQAKFAAGFEKEVVGKSIDKLALTVVNGSSLTPIGFMDAVKKVQLVSKAS